jgi:hypothetical protein
MLGTQPRHDADKSPPHLDIFAAAATEIMWAVALATTRAAAASTAHSLALWAHILRAPALCLPPGPWSTAHGPFGTNPQPTTGAPTDVPARNSAPEAAPAEAPAFASYRSSGGHATAQVTRPH